MIDLGHKNVIDVVKYRFVWFLVSAILILPGIGAMIYSAMHSEYHSPLKVGIDFTGGTITQYTTANEIKTSQISKIRDDLKAVGIENAQIQIINANSTEMAKTAQAKKDKKVEEKVKEEQTENVEKAENVENAENSTYTGDINYIISIRSKFIDETNSEMYSQMTEAVKLTAPDATIEQVSSVGPTLGTELLQKSMWAMFWVFVVIIAYIAWRFKLDYSIIAVLSLLHDVLFIVGVFSIFGLVFGTEVDSLFITALLTVVGFSNHDTIVVFDRIRENMRFYSKKATTGEIINASVNQTLARSINTSVTTLLTLLALYIFGGVTTRDFVLVMILGIFIGTYSSIFFASALLAWYKEKFQKGGKSVAKA